MTSLQAGAGAQSTVWSTSRGGEDEKSDEYSSSGGEDDGHDSDLDARDETREWIDQQRDKLALARERRGSDVSDLSTDSDMESRGIIAPPRRPGQPRGRGREGAKPPPKSVRFGGDASPEPEPDPDPEGMVAPPNPPPGVQAPLFRPQTLGGVPAVTVNLPSAGAESPVPAGEADGEEQLAVDQAPPAWMFQADAPNKKYQHLPVCQRVSTYGVI